MERTNITLKDSINEFKHQVNFLKWWLACLPYVIFGSITTIVLVCIVWKIVSLYFISWNDMWLVLFVMCLLHAIFGTWSVRLMIHFYKFGRYGNFIQVLLEQRPFRDTQLAIVLYFAAYLSLYSNFSTTGVAIVSIFKLLTLGSLVVFIHILALSISAYQPIKRLRVGAIIMSAFILARKYFVELLLNFVIYFLVLFVSICLIIPFIWTVPYMTYHLARLITTILDNEGTEYQEVKKWYLKEENI